MRGSNKREPLKTFKYKPGPDRFVDEDWIYRHSEWMERWEKYQQEKKPPYRRLFMVIKDEELKELRLGWQYQRAYEKAFKESKIDEIYEKLGELYGIDSYSKKTTKKKI